MQNELLNDTSNLTVKKIQTETKFFSKLLKKTNYLLSGSSILSICYMKDPQYNDFDLYFLKKSDRNKAISILKKSTEYNCIYKSKYAITFSHKKNKKKIQVVKTLTKSATYLARSHDFANCSAVFISNKNYLYTTPEFHKAWNQSLLEINVTPLLNSRCKSHRFLNQLSIFLIRIKKYKERYCLKESPNLLKALKVITAKLFKETNSNQHDFKLNCDYVCVYTGATYCYTDILSKAFYKDGYLTL